MIKKKDLSVKDKKIWEDYIKNPTDVFDKDRGNEVSIKKNYRFKFDLHGFTLDEANKKVRDIILSSIESNYKEILFITGKGIHSTNEKDIYSSKNFGKLKYSVPDFIKSNEELNRYVISIEQADVKDGGDGAIVIKLKNL